MFYLLSLLTGILECGWILNGICHSLPLWHILCYPLAYHLGNLFPKPFAVKKIIISSMCIASLLITINLFFLKKTTMPDIFQFMEWSGTCLRLFMLSAVIQSVRSDMKQKGNRLLKRVARVGGFLLSVLAIWIPEILFFGATVIAFFALPYYRQKPHLTCMENQGGYSSVMIFHQLHYFFYAHITLAAVSIGLGKGTSPLPFLDYVFNRNPQAVGCILAILLFCGTWITYMSVEPVGCILAILLFCGTWITYMSVEPVLSRLTNKVTLVFYIGHSVICLLLLIMSRVTVGTEFIILWLLTGFGGGTVYTISARAKSKGTFDKSSMTVAENIGHTLGLLASVVVAACFGDNSPSMMLVHGSVSAFFAIISMTLTIRKEKHHESISNNC